MKSKHDIIWVDETDSTNEEARRRFSDLDNLSVLSAHCQTSGRGQRGNTWESEAGKNLTFSIVIKYGAPVTGSDLFIPHFRAVDQFSISETTALSIVDLLGLHGISAKIKWPNDIYAGNRKICGILIDNSLSGNLLSHSVIGVGLNVNQTVFAPILPNPTSMLLSGADVQSLPELLEEFTFIFKNYCRRYLNITGGLSRLRKLYLSQLWRYDEPARFIDTSAGREFQGRIKGINDIGLLIVEDMEKGELKEFAFKEIAYVI